MKIRVLIVLFLFSFSPIRAISIFFPELHIHSEMDQNFNMTTSHKIDLVVDSGKKYGLKVNIGLNGFQVNNIESNKLALNSVNLKTSPFHLFNLEYFFGKSITLGYNEVGYQGIQFHYREHFEYYGYKTIRGTGLSISKKFWDELLFPYLFIYQDPDSSLIHFDSLTYLTLDNYRFETYFGIDNNLNYTFGVTLKSIYGNLDFMLSLYKPDGSFSSFPTLDDFYINFTEHVIVGFFEQTITIFGRPSTFNGYAESIQNDVDAYLMIGMVIDRFGFGLENTVLYASSYTLTDRIGSYFYYQLNNLKYKIGAYYNAVGNAFNSSWGVTIDINGQL